MTPPPCGIHPSRAGSPAFSYAARAQGTTARPLDGDALSFGRARALANGPVAVPLPSFAPAATGCRRVVVLSDCGAKEEKGKGKGKEEEEGEPDLLRWLPSSPTPTTTIDAAADACAARERGRDTREREESK